MSDYNRERGTVILPKSKVNEVKKAIVAAHNADLAKAYELSLKLWENKKVYSPGKNVFDQAAAYRIIGYNASRHSEGIPVYEMAVDNARWNRGLKPKKKDFAPASTRGDVHLEFGHDYEITIEGNVLTWETDCNNYQVEQSHRTSAYKAMVKVLNSLSYNKNSGGYFEQWSEYGESWRVVRQWGK